MKEEETNRLDILFNLSKLSWQQFNERRTWEVKISITFWTALALAIAGSVSLQEPLELPGGRRLLVVGAVLVFGLHVWWCCGLARAQQADRRIAFFYERELRKTVGVAFDKELETFLKGVGRGMGSPMRWNYVLQYSVTLLLAAALVLANWGRVGGSVSTLPEEVLEMSKLQLEVEKLELEIATLRATPDCAKSTAQEELPRRNP